MIGTLRVLGLTLAEISGLTVTYLERTEEPIGPRLAEVLRAVHSRTEDRITESHQLLQRIDDYQSEFCDQLAGRPDFCALDPHFRCTRG